MIPLRKIHVMASLLLMPLLGLIAFNERAISATHPFEPGAPIVDFDLQGFIDQKVAVGEKEIVVPPGRYRVTPKGRVHLALKDLDGVKIVARGVQMICTETTLAVSIDNCRDTTLIGLTIDYDPLPFTQGRITALGPDNSWIEFEIIEGYPENLVARIEIFDGRTKLLKTPTRYDWKPFESLGNRRYRVSKGEEFRFNPDADREEVGDILVTNSETVTNGSAPHGITIAKCTNLVLEDITQFGSNCFAYLEYYCDNTTYRRCAIIPCPPELDLQKRGLRRIRSSNADAFHSKHAIRGPQYLECVARFQGDDCINICGQYYMVMGSVGPRVRILALGEINIKEGHPVELVSYSGERLPDAKVLKIEPDESVCPEEIAFLQEQRMNASNRERLSTPGTQAMTITLDREVDLPMGSVIASMNHTGNGFLVKDCDFGFNRSRGILIKASNGKVVGNTIAGSKGAAILVAPEWWWLESGSSNNVEISDNKIKDCGERAIEVIANAGNGSVAPAGAHRNITIQNNSMTSCPMPAIKVTSTDGLIIKGNQIVNPLESGNSTDAENIELINCLNVESDTAVRSNP
jgi:hypothetical protein